LHPEKKRKKYNVKIKKLTLENIKLALLVVVKSAEKNREKVSDNRKKMNEQIEDNIEYKVRKRGRWNKFEN
jgi:ribosome recycling factor